MKKIDEVDFYFGMENEEEIKLPTPEDCYKTKGIRKGESCKISNIKPFMDITMGDVFSPGAKPVIPQLK